MNKIIEPGAETPADTDNVACVCEESSELSVVHLRGDLNIADARAVQKVFLDAVKRNKPIQLDLEELRKIDLAILQLMLSLTISAERSDVALELKSIPESVADIIRASGFISERFHPLPGFDQPGSVIQP